MLGRRILLLAIALMCALLILEIRGQEAEDGYAEGYEYAYEYVDEETPNTEEAVAEPELSKKEQRRQESQNKQREIQEKLSQTAEEKEETEKARIIERMLQVEHADKHAEMLRRTAMQGGYKKAVGSSVVQVHTKLANDRYVFK
tara:strand:- start:118 stop:549 length:432 start_codon:yes stop_codon:yes gene_type:complete